ncbi:hypothetical protein Tco_1469355, partial [Tanacetum coccineum]
MDHHEIDEIDYVADEVDVLDFVMDDVEADGVVNHVAHDFDVMVTDTSSAQARKGKDIQGIPWDRLN